MIVVTGATGNVGRWLVRALAEAGQRVTAVSRGTAPVSLPSATGHVRADLAAPETLRPALDGAEALFLHDGGTGGVGLDPRAILDVAEAAGVRRVVLLSSQGVVTRPESVSHGGVMRAVEEAVRESGLGWTILRPGVFASNAYAWAESVRAERTVAAPFGDVGIPVIDPADIAEVAAVALRKDEHAGRVYVLNGPAAVTPRQQAEAIGAALGEPVRFVELTRAEARARMAPFMPEASVETSLAVLGEPNAAELKLSPDVEHVLGRAPRPFAEWARRNAEAFR
ncbi:NAD(P)H-binding protein [Microbispora bryophytorum]|uniref:NmrA family transcriptional regulator n=1 Tax=Microbispora bryophytorum TaxID=1460882 RepID=A0A8H9GYN5_9ACTN|nr:NAD(P)H-binding protein [Microbispora bryophytorum]MBD3134715.1 NAD(P)H-binding protein [Microbispora bryophytorum]TQS09005.1 NAD-dependent epimerase/dehydratase family protein [Microbispora bryophytorum]GGO12662.1 NmrA family transcriptional regulator [Microbispora bryophytorum]